MQRPNILFLFSDQHRFDCLGVNGHRRLQTPNLDALAQQGVNFTHTFCPVPMCVPARCSLLTGTWAWRHGTTMNFDGPCYRPMDRTLPTYPALLNEQGYYTAHVGRWHVTPDTNPHDFGYAHHVAGGGYEPPMQPGGYGQWRAQQGLPPQPDTGFFGGVDSHITAQQHFLTWEADQTIASLHQAAQHDQSFLIEWHTVTPHLPNIVPEPWASMYDPQTLDPWPGFDDPLKDKPFIQAQQLRTWKVDHWTWSDWAPIVARYLGEISLYDQQIGRVLTALEKLGLRDNTLIVYTSDHGDLCGSHGMIDKHFVMYDDVLRVPMIISGPNGFTGGGANDAFIYNALDLPYTFLQLAGAAPPTSFVGRDLAAVIANRDPHPRHEVYAHYSGNQFGLFSQRMLRDRNYKYVWNPTAQDELYDLQDDPAEISNIAMDPANRDCLQRMRARLVAQMRAAADPLLNLWTQNQLLEGLKP